MGAIGWEGKTKIYRMDAWKNPSPHPSKFNTLYTIYVYCCFLIFLFNSFFLDSFQLNSNCFIFVAWVDAGNVYWKIDVYIIEKRFLWYNNSFLFLFLSLSMLCVASFPTSFSLSKFSSWNFLLFPPIQKGANLIESLRKKRRKSLQLCMKASLVHIWLISQFIYYTHMM